MKETILAINPGSTSTKIAVYEGERLLFESNIHHSNEELSTFSTIVDQFEYRRDAILADLKSHVVDLSQIDAVVGRGGLIYPIASGIYGVNDRMKEDLRNSPVGHHASNLGGLIADEIAREISIKTSRDVRAYVADPVVVDEMQDVARVSGHPLFERKSIFHALNQKAVARLYAAKVGRKYEDMNLIVAHLGGGISIGAHAKGRVVDVNNTLDGEGPFTPERSGTLPVGDLVRLCFSGKYTESQIKKMVKGEGGLVAHLGTNDTIEILQRIENGDQHAALVLDALCYNVSKYIGSMATVLCGNIDAILITGGMAYSEKIVNGIRSRVEFLSQVVIFPGQDEMHALAFNALGVLRGQISPMTYAPKAR